MEKFKKIQRLVQSSRRIAILCHTNADPDSLCSGFALSYLLRKTKKRLNVELIAPGGVSKVSQAVARALPMKFSNTLPASAFDLIFTVDANTTQQLGDARETVEKSGAPVVVIDHHAPDPFTRKLAAVFVSDQNASSTAEVVHSISKQLKVTWSRSVAQILLTGMIYDSNHFALARPNTLRVAVDLLDCGADPRKSIAILRLPIDDSERMARIKAAQRADVNRICGWIVATSDVGSHQGSAARALIMLGAQVAVVGGEKKGSIQISLRSTDEFHKKTGVHLGTDIARPLGELIGGMGGGHAVASGVAGRGELGKVLKESTVLIEKKLRESDNRPTQDGVSAQHL